MTNINTHTDSLQYIDPDEVRLQNGKDSPNLWIVIDDVVYDCTHFVKSHSGGDAVIRRFAGKDCSCMFGLSCPAVVK
ncbi:cytochrome b5-like heme/steroid binding domain-containing protein [Aspergillus pseudoustus]|uniref:Cytochrome b5-like heme/steroid binding domain-containing protein n=1 Tax=Aspergillus pseudoustus TaxID=1810923 RepID=A0ABR4K6B4_9EURO